MRGRQATGVPIRLGQRPQMPHGIYDAHVRAGAKSVGTLSVGACRHYGARRCYLCKQVPFSRDTLQDMATTALEAETGSRYQVLDGARDQILERARMRRTKPSLGLIVIAAWQSLRRACLIQF